VPSTFIVSYKTKDNLFSSQSFVWKKNHQRNGREMISISERSISNKMCCTYFWKRRIYPYNPFHLTPLWPWLQCSLEKSKRRRIAPQLTLFCKIIVPILKTSSSRNLSQDEGQICCWEKILFSSQRIFFSYKLLFIFCQQSKSLLMHGSKFLFQALTFWRSLDWKISVSPIGLEARKFVACQ